MKTMLEDEKALSTFKSPIALTVYRVFFWFWKDVPMTRAIACVESRSPRLLALLPS